MPKSEPIKLNSNHYWRQLQLEADPFPLSAEPIPYITPRWHQYINFLLNIEQYRHLLLLVVGPNQVGKSTLLQIILQRLKQQTITPISVLQIQAHAKLNPKEFAVLLAKAFTLPAGMEPDIHFNPAEELTELKKTGKRYMVFIDDAEQLPLETQQFCLNLIKEQASIAGCLQIVLFGSLNLVDQFKKIVQQQGDLSHTHIINTLRIDPFSRDDLQRLIKSHLQAAGYTGRITLFSKTDSWQLYEETGGLPGKIITTAREFLLELASPNSLADKPNNTQDNIILSFFDKSRWWIAILIVIAILLFWVLPWLQDDAKDNMLKNEITPAKAISFSAPAAVNSSPAVSSSPAPAVSSMPPAASTTPKPAISPPIPTNTTPGERVVINGNISTVPAATANADTVAIAVAPIQYLSADELTDTEKRLLKVSSKIYTLQLFLSSSPDNVQAFVNQHNIADLAAIFRTIRNKQIVYVVTLGYFPSKKEAANTIYSLDPALQKLKPFPRSFASVHKDILRLEHK